MRNGDNPLIEIAIREGRIGYSERADFERQYDVDPEATMAKVARIPASAQRSQENEREAFDESYRYEAAARLNLDGPDGALI